MLVIFRLEAVVTAFYAIVFFFPDVPDFVLSLYLKSSLNSRIRVHRHDQLGYI